MRPGRHSRAAAIAVVALAATLLLAACGPDKSLKEPKPEGLAIELGGVNYNVYITRQLNIHDAEDRDYYAGPDAPRGSNLYGVFVNVCNAASKPRQAARDFEITDTQGHRFKPIPLPLQNHFAYHARVLAPRGCIPEPGSAAATGPTAGSMILFSLPIFATENRPLELEIKSPEPSGVVGGKQQVAKIKLDI
jgi:hypothetical protein